MIADSFPDSFLNSIWGLGLGLGFPGVLRQSHTLHDPIEVQDDRSDFQDLEINSEGWIDQSEMNGVVRAIQEVLDITRFKANQN